MRVPVNGGDGGFASPAWVSELARTHVRGGAGDSIDLATQDVVDHFGDDYFLAHDADSEAAAAIDVFLVARAATRARALEVAHGVDDLDRSDVEALINSIPFARLTNEKEVHQRAVRAAKWKPLVAYFRSHAEGIPDKRLEPQLATLLARMADDLRRQWPGTMHGYGADDAVQDAVLVLLKRKDSSTIEDLPGWMRGVARNLLRARGRRANREGELLPKTLPPSAHNPIAAVSFGDLQEWSGRYQLVERTFRSRREVVRVIWKALVRDDGVSDLELSFDCAAVLGVDVPLGTVSGLRGRLRKRLAAVDFIRTQVAVNGYADEPGDVSLEQWVGTFGSVRNEDRSTLRVLGALARSAKDQPSLAGPLLSFLVVEEHMSAADAGAALANFPGARAEALAEALRRTDQALGKTQSRSIKLRAAARRLHLHHAASACWCLVVVRELPPGESPQWLRPFPVEEKPMVAMASILA